MIAEGMEKEEPRRRRRCWLHDVELPANGECDECSKLMPVRQSVTVTVFADGDDDGYRAWVAVHRGGYVINIQRNYNPSDAILHQADCHTINGEPARGDVFVGDYVKVCAVRRVALDDWARRQVGTLIPPCGLCF
jgi:hypothetical protein